VGRDGVGVGDPWDLVGEGRVGVFDVSVRDSVHVMVPRL